MPVLKGFGTRAEDCRELGQATVLVFFPQAVKRIAFRDKETGCIAFRSEPDPHQRALNLADLRSCMANLDSSTDTYKFYRQAEKMLLDHIESFHAHEVKRAESEGTLMDGDFITDALKI